MKGPTLYTDPNGFRKGHNIDKKSVTVPSSSITMTEEDGSPLETGPLYGTGTTTGETKYMEPGKNYEFTGDNEVVETKPAFAYSGTAPLKDRVRSPLDPHTMAHAKHDRGEGPDPHAKGPTYKSPLLEKISKPKWRKDGTLKKVVTIDKETGYRSIIRFDKEGRIKSAKNNQTKNRHRKDPRRLSRSAWIREDMAVYSNDPNIISTKDYFPEEKEKIKEETAEEKRNRIYNRGSNIISTL